MAHPPLTPRTVSAVTNAASMPGGLDSSNGFKRRSGLESSIGFQAPMSKPLTPRAPDLPRMGAVGPNVRTSSAKNAFRTTPQSARQTTVSGEYLLPGSSAGYDMSKRVKADTSLIFGEDADVPHLKGVHTASSALEQDEARHWMKWGCGGKGPTDMLKQLAEELKQLFHSIDETAGGQGQWFPDKRTQRIHEQMLHISNKIAKQPPKPPTPPGLPEKERPARPEKPRTPPSVTKEENIRLRRELAEKKAQVDALENTFAAYVPMKHKAKARDDWLRQYALKGRFLAYDATGGSKVFGAWAKAVSKVCVPRKLKAQHAQIVQRELDVALVAWCLSTWATSKRDTLARAHSTLTFASWMDRGQQDSMVIRCFAAWAYDVCLSHLQHMQQKLEEAHEVKKRLCQRFGEAAMAQLRKQINADDATLLQWSLSFWVQYVEEAKKERQAQEEAAAAAEKLRQQQLAAAERCFSRSARKLTATSFSGWRAEVEATRLAAKKLEQNMAKTLKTILGSEIILQAECVTAWEKTCKVERAARQLAEMELAQRLVANARQRALNMLDKNFTTSVKTLQQTCLGEWHKHVANIKLIRKKKDGVLARAMRSIATLDKTILQNTLTPWIQEHKRKVAKDKRIDQVLRSLGLSGKAMKSEVFLLWSRVASDLKQERLQEEARLQAEAAEERARQRRLAAAERCFCRAASELKKTVWSGWFAQVEVERQARKKLEQGMSQAMKIIMSSEIGLQSACVQLWAEVSRHDRLERQKHEAAIANRLVANARQRALNMLHKNLASSAATIKAACLNGWYQDVETTKQIRKRKDGAVARAMRSIATLDKTLMQNVLTPWIERFKEQKAKDLRLDQVLRSLGISGKALQAEIVLRWSHAAHDLRQERLHEEEAARLREEARLQREAADEKARAQRLAAAERCFGRAARTLVATSFRGWKDEVQASHRAARKLQESMSKAMKIILTSENGLKSLIVECWAEACRGDRLKRQQAEADLVRKLLANARERAMKMLNKNFASSAAAIQAACMREWQQFVETVKQIRKRKDGAIARALRSIATLDKTLLQNTLTPWIEAHKRQKAKDKRIEQVLRSLGMSGRALQTQILLVWKGAAKELKKERLDEEARKQAEAAEEKARKRRLAAAERCFCRAAKTLVATTWSGWWAAVDATRKAIEKFEQGMSKAMRAMLGSEKMLITECVSAWAQAVKDEHVRRQLAEMEMAKQLVANAREKAINMLQKNLASSAAVLQRNHLYAWHEARQNALLMLKKKDANMARASLLVEANDKMLQSYCCGVWLLMAANSKLLKTIEVETKQETRKSFLELAQGVVTRLHKRQAVKDPFNAWVARALG